MSYASVDALQKTLSEQVFHYASDSKKAAGRALGTLVEIITFYTLRSWGFRHALAIERPLPEYGNPAITHNVEYSLHPVVAQSSVRIDNTRLPLSAAKICKAAVETNPEWNLTGGSNQLLSSSKILKNACVIAETKNGPCVAHLDSFSNDTAKIHASLLHRHPFAIFECKRVGIEEGNKKGPQTIEKAKQGAYVARTVSSLQKVRLKDGGLGGLIHPLSGPLICEPYEALLKKIIESNTADLLRDFVLTVGVVSNHGNWFTSENHNKELKVLAQSYDWLLFLTDKGLAEFISEMLLKPTRELLPAKTAFLASYTGEKGKNRFTKTQMDMDADAVLFKYFSKNAKRVERWFNIITPSAGTLGLLRRNLDSLSHKNWGQIHSL